MSDKQNTAAGKPKIGGAISVAPVGTALPTDSFSPLDKAFRSLGYISEDGLVNNGTINTEIIKAWGGDPVIVVNNGREDKFKFTLLEVLNPDVLKFVYGKDNVQGELESGIHLRVNGQGTEDVAIVIDLILRSALKRIVISSAHVTEVGEVKYAGSSAVGYETTVTCTPDEQNDMHHEYIKKAPGEQEA